MTDSFGSRLRFARQRWKLSQDELADKAGLGVATIRRSENGYFDPRLSTAQKLADALQVRVEWLLTGDADVMVWPHHLTFEEQMQSRPPEGSGHPETVLIMGSGPWYRDDEGAWHVEGA
jgi:transcriptional regulator with XRE-family HTH domain